VEALRASLLTFPRSRGLVGAVVVVTCGSGKTVAVIRGGNATVYVSDMQRAVEFYHDTLGLHLVFRAGDHWAELDAGGGFHLGLHPASARGPGPGTAGGITVGLAVNEPIVEVVEKLTSRGVSFQGPVRDDGGIRLAFFTDPDGNQLYLAETGGSDG
jgi:catechol 2,3-dioxygenase-like lactoylglutathione lyase family enzyme